ncbi:MAG: stage V sporulation protein AD [Eubacteriales bacterium]|nr:stage V sporulation protein AD [Eubacteriales bacterium]MDD4389656.1 stage V sporulation protein AD [Eubacteriales bacterium]
MKNKIGKQTFVFRNKPVITGECAVVGTKEGQGPLKEYFDTILEDDTYGENTWEKAESRMMENSIMTAIRKAGLEKKNIEVMLTGDLLNQLMSSSFSARDIGVPFIGLYGACSTMTLSMLMSSIIVDGEFAENVVCAASSHYCTAERQFRMPLEHGNQKPPSAQWTATASGAAVISKNPCKSNETLIPIPKEIFITHGTVGKIIDTGMKDSNQMGAAMVPAAVDTILNHFEDTGRTPDDYDIILTGDLGYIGKEIALDLFADAGLNMKKMHLCYDDCGTMLYYRESEDVHGGGSGCGCSASVFTGYLFKKMRAGIFNRALIVSTGAMLSTISPFQGESIPGIAHAIAIETS